MKGAVMAKVTTPVFRAAFTQVFEAKQINGQGKAKFSVAMLFDPKEIKKDPQQQRLLKVMVDMVDVVAKEKWTKIPAKLKKPFKDGDEQINSKTDEVYEGFAGMKVVNASSETRPGLVDQEMNPITEPGEFYGGVYAQATVNIYAWEHPTGGKGVSIGLQNIQKVRDGDAFGGGKSSPEDDFEPIGSVVVEGEEEDDLFS